MSTSIFVMAHKPYIPPADAAYHTMFVGAVGKEDIMPGCFRDDRGDDHISDLNPYFSELTGLYWLWKNYPGQENIGICHYRRFFVNTDKRIMTGSEFDEILNSYDIIVPKYSPTDKTNRENYAEAHFVKDMDMTGYALKKLYPEYATAFDEMTQAHGTYFGNLFVTTRELFDDYCEYLFGILTEVSANIDISGYNDYEKRVYGFLSEFLLMPFIKARELRVFETPVAYSAEKAETHELVAATGELLREGKTQEARSFLDQMLAIRPDLMLPDSDLSGELLLTVIAVSIKAYCDETGENNYFTRENDLNALLIHLKKCYSILRSISDNGEISGDESGYMRFTGFDSAQAQVILSADPSGRLGEKPLSAEKIQGFFNGK